MFETPILFLIFNRPDTTKQTFEAISRQKPKYLYIAADGPRPDNANDIELCKTTKSVVSQIDWDCQVKTLYQDKNLGCGLAPATAITWFFGHVEEGIILEDDCVPNDSFFHFCGTLLIKFKHEDKIMHITGTNLDDSIKYGDGSYFYSHYPNVWGWATWRRAWEKANFEFSNKKIYTELINQKFKYKSERVFWSSRILLIEQKLIAAWDYQWMFSIWMANGLCVNSNYNLVENIGFGVNSTHTTGSSPYKSTIKREIDVIKHPPKTQVINKAEKSFIYLLHGLKRQNAIEMYFHKYLIQRFINLLHKIRLRIKNAY